MAERNRSRRRSLRVWLIAAAFVAVGACGNNVDSRARLIDQACTDSTCETTGNALKTTGVTEDSIGFKVGPGGGKVSIPIPPYSTPNNYISVEVLVAGHGKYTGRLVLDNCASDGGACTPTTVDTSAGYVQSDYDWQAVGSYSAGSNNVGFSGLKAEVETTDSSSEVDVIDVRFQTFDTVSCSVARPGPTPWRRF